MIESSHTDSLVERAVAIVGSQVGLATRLGVSVQAVNQVVNGVRPLPARWAIPIEEATDGAITRYELRPDVFGARKSAPSSPSTGVDDAEVPPLTAAQLKMVLRQLIREELKRSKGAMG